jgi:hypothetical protein
MKQLVIMPGGFHPFHAGHLALYQSAEQAFPGADVKVAATNDTSTRPFPFALKEKLAQLAGVPPGNFYQVKSPFRAEEITKSYDPATTQLIFVRSEKDANKPPVAGGMKKDGTPAYLQPISDDMAPMNQHAYMAYLPTVEFGPGMTSATEIRSAWPSLNQKRKTALVMSLYPKTQANPKLAATVVKMLDTAMGTQDVAEGLDEAVGGNYLYHSTQDANTAKQILSSGYILGSNSGKQPASDAQTTLPTVSFGRSIGYQTSGVNVDRDYQVVFVFDRAAIETRYKTLGTSQSQNVRGLANPIDTEWGGKVAKLGKVWGLDANADGKVDYKEIGNVSKSAASNMVKKGVSAKLNAPKAGGEFEEIVPTKTGKIPLQGLLVGFYLVPGKAASKDPELLNDPRRLDMPRPNQFTKAAQPQSVAEAGKKFVDPELYRTQQYAKQHYPGMADPQSAFDKWVTRSLMHSDKDDHDQDKRLQQLAKEITAMKTKIQDLQQNADYLDESR